jgi:hypothetical protein
LNDTDDKGFSVFNQLKPGKNIMVLNESKIYKSHKNIFALLLPMPSCRNKYVSHNLNKGELCIELLFEDITLEKYKEKVNSFFDIVDHYGNSIKIIKDSAKLNFANSTIDFVAEDFVHFIPIFNTITEIIKFD